ncbi:MAG TPA: hypothetical protein VMC82_06065 [Thermoplasmata archaeon]|nr:hypothetical protein [Thermoplasmata archaeon]
MVIGIVQVGFNTTASPPAAGEDIIVDDFVILGVPNTSFFVSVQNYESGISYTNQIRNVKVSRIHATWNASTTGASGFVIQGSAREVVVEDCTIDTSALTSGVDCSNCFVHSNSGDCEQIRVTRCTFIQNGLSGQIMEIQGNASGTNPSQRRDLHFVLIEDCIFNSGASSPVVGGSGGGYIDDNNGTGASGFVYDIEFRRCSFINTAISFQSAGSQFGYLRFSDGAPSTSATYPTGFSGSLAGRGPNDPGVAVTVPASGSPYYNTDGFDEVVLVSGGTVTAIKRNGTTTGLTTGEFLLRDGDSLTVTYSVAPTMTKQSL